MDDEEYRQPTITHHFPCHFYVFSSTVLIRMKSNILPREINVFTTIFEECARKANRRLYVEDNNYCIKILIVLRLSTQT